MGANIAGAVHGPTTWPDDLVQPAARVEPPWKELRRTPEVDRYGISVSDNALLHAAFTAGIVPRVAPRTVHIVQAFLSAVCPTEIEPEPSKHERENMQEVSVCRKVRERG